MDLQIIQNPVAEPVTLSDVKLQLGFGPMQDTDRAASEIVNEKLRRFIVAARRECESFTRRVFVTQRWLLRLNGFPGSDWRYNWRGYPAILLPKPPFQSVEFVKYVDVAGAVQDLPFDTTYGNGSPQYGYQLARGDEIEPARIFSSWARPWPPVRMVPSNVLVQFRCGYGGPITVSMSANSATLTVTSGQTFNPDDAPRMVGDTGLPISIPGAGLSGTTLNTSISSVDSSGNATLRDQAKTAVTNITAWTGQPVPAEITNAIKLIVEAYYDKGSEGCDMPGVARRELEYYRNHTA